MFQYIQFKPVIYGKDFFELLSAFLFRCKRQEVSESKQKSKKGIT